MNYKPLYVPEQVILGSGVPVIVTGWTPKEYVARRLKESDYSAVANLYSPTRGINFLVRNLLANPKHNVVLVYEATKEDRNAGACQCLMDFFAQGFEADISSIGKRCWRIKSSITGYIDEEVGGDALEELRQETLIVRFTALEDLMVMLELDWNRLQFGNRTSRVFPMKEFIPTTMPGKRNGHAVEANTVASAWVQAVHRIKTVGVVRETQHGEYWQELLNLTIVVTGEGETLDELELPEPNYLPVDRAFIADYQHHILEDTTVGQVHYSYGQRLRSWFAIDQIKGVIDLLSKDPDSARAVMNCWDAKADLGGDSPPCLNQIWVRISEGRLTMTAVFRSNDIFSAWAANAYGLRLLQAHIRDGIAAVSGNRYPLGDLTTLSESAHIYQSCFEYADKLIDQEYQVSKPKYDDPCGNFLIDYTAETNSYVLVQTTPGSGEEVNRWESPSPTKLMRQLASDIPHIQPNHAAYIGYTLGRLQADHDYRQDGV